MNQGLYCDYGCGRLANVTFQNGKKCCMRRCHLCPAQINKTKATQHTVNPATGLTPLEQRQKTLKETFDPISGLSLFELRIHKMAKTQTTPNPLTGKTPRDVAEQKLQQIDPETGKTLKQLAALKAAETLRQIDPVTGLTGIQQKTSKTKAAWKDFDLYKKQEIQTKRQKSLDSIDPKTGLSKRQLQGLTISKNKKVIDPTTGLSKAQLTAQKNKNNIKWLENNSKGRASKQSLKLFKPLVDLLANYKLKIFLGCEDNREWFLHDFTNQCVRFYDFCIPDLKIIIEYHGEQYHPNPQLLNEQTWKTWRMPYTGISADIARANDILKENLAITNGFDYHIVWSSENIQDAISRLFSIIVLKHKNLTLHNSP